MRWVLSRMTNGRGMSMASSEQTVWPLGNGFWVPRGPLRVDRSETLPGMPASRPALIGSAPVVPTDRAAPDRPYSAVTSRVASVLTVVKRGQNIVASLADPGRRPEPAWLGHWLELVQRDPSIRSDFR